SPSGMTADRRLHEKLILIDTPDSSSAISLVGRLAVVRPENDDVIVVEAKKKSPDAGATQTSVEAIYQVIGSRPDALLSSPAASRRFHRAELYGVGAGAGVGAGTGTRRRAQPMLPSIMQNIEKEANASASGAANSRPIATPRSRISTLRPAHRRMPSSRAVHKQGPLYTEKGGLVARRPSTLLALADKAERTVGSTESKDNMDVTESFCNDPGYDLVNAEIDSLFGQSFDMDMLPEAPVRRVSHYNIGVKDVPRLSPAPSVSEPEEQAEQDGMSPAAVQPDERSRQRFVHRTLGVISEDAQFAKPVIHEKDIDFYIRMLTLRAKARGL
ncbi:hypothetical protein LPJ56_007103, partial [Coemansia sp. RSA 2599]